MARTSRMSKTCWLLLLLTSTALADGYADARTEMVAAYQASDFAAMRSAAQKALAARPGYPGALFNLALAQALDDDPAASLDTLRDLLAVGVDFNVAEIPAFADLKNLLEWGDYAAGVERLNEPVGFAEWSPHRPDKSPDDPNKHPTSESGIRTRPPMANRCRPGPVCPDRVTSQWQPDAIAGSAAN